MKKYLVLLILLFIITGCANEEKEVVEEPKTEPTTIPVPAYTDENVSTKVIKLIQSYVGIVNKMVWRKF